MHNYENSLWKKKVMVNNFTNINKAHNPLAHSLTEHKEVPSNKKYSIWQNWDSHCVKT
jgi:hypothetical protein